MRSEASPLSIPSASSAQARWRNEKRNNYNDSVKRVTPFSRGGLQTPWSRRGGDEASPKHPLPKLHCSKNSMPIPSTPLKRAYWKIFQWLTGQKSFISMNADMDGQTIDFRKRRSSPTAPHPLAPSPTERGKFLVFTTIYHKNAPPGRSKSPRRGADPATVFVAGAG